LCRWIELGANYYMLGISLIGLVVVEIILVTELEFMCPYQQSKIITVWVNVLEYYVCICMTISPSITTGISPINIPH
jgi:hypothetical protein